MVKVIWNTSNQGENVITNLNFCHLFPKEHALGLGAEPWRFDRWGWVYVNNLKFIGRSIC